MALFYLDYLQFSIGWPPGICHQTPTTDPERCGLSGIQRPQTLSFNVTPLLTDLHWLPVIALIKLKTLVLAYQTVPQLASKKQIRPYTPLCSATSGRLPSPPRLTCTSHLYSPVPGPMVVQ